MKTDERATTLISQEEVRKALDNLLYATRQVAPSPLVGLALIHDMLSDPAMPPGVEARDFALNRLLTDCIRDQFTRQRRAFELDDPNSYATRPKALASIAADAHIGSPELLGWGWLYYRFVRVDLYITRELFSQRAHIDPRTLRRYQQHGLKRLTLCLIEQERVARAADRQRRALADG